MKRPLVAVLFLFVSFSLSAQIRIDLGIAAGTQSYEAPTSDSHVLVSPEVMFTRGPLAAYYNLDYAKLSTPDINGGVMYASHFGAAYRWQAGRNVTVSAGAGPSYITNRRLGGKFAWHAQAELAWRTGMLEWFGKVRYYDYDLESHNIATASPDGPALLGGVRVTLNP